MFHKKRKALAEEAKQKQSEEGEPEIDNHRLTPETVAEPELTQVQYEKTKNEHNKRTKFSWNQLNAVVPHDFKGLALIGIAIIACTISTALTMKFVSEVRGDAGWITLGLGMMWELSKYTFGPIAILHAEQKMRVVLGATTIILILGSVYSLNLLEKLFKKYFSNKLSYSSF